MKSSRTTCRCCFCELVAAMEHGLSYPDIILPRLRYRYCPMCATPLTRRVAGDDGIARVTCPECGWVHYPTNITSVVVLVEHQGGIVAILPPDVPQDTPAALPAGHAEYGESPEQAAVREAYEETGLTVEIDRCLGWWYEHTAEYPGPNVRFMFVAHSVGGDLRPSDESGVGVFPLQEFPMISPERTGSYRTLQSYRAGRSSPERVSGE